jgi:Ca2+/H+ antiporter, TMEM165/GDT1 family
MGDKTQLLSMAFAMRYSPLKVLIGVSIAVIVNHALAVVVGHFLTVLIPMEIITFIAAISFILFGLWTLRGDKLRGEDKKKSRFGPITTVAIAFFLAEMGDKTQLATISLAVEYNNMLFVLLGTTTAMIVADGIGIGVSILMRKRLPERIIKWISASVFIIFGFIGLFDALSGTVNPWITSLVMFIIGILTTGVAYYLVRVRNKSR